MHLKRVRKLLVARTGWSDNVAAKLRTCDARLEHELVNCQALVNLAPVGLDMRYRRRRP